jgi:hypothetical protein
MAAAYEWDQIQRIFLRVVDLPSPARSMVLEQMCGGEPALRGKARDARFRYRCFTLRAGTVGNRSHSLSCHAFRIG